MVLLTGNEAVACGATDAGVEMATGYPGTPASEIIDYLATHVKDMYVEWSTNEKVAFEFAAGASYAGVRSMCVMKHLGVNVISDALTVVAYTGVDGGLLLVVTDDPQPFSSQSAIDTRYYAKLAKIPCIEPIDGQETYEMVGAGLDLSERLSLPVMLRATPRISHARFDVHTSAREKQPQKGREFKYDPKRYVMIAPHTAVNHVILNKKMEKATEEAERFPYNAIEWADDSLGIIASGISYNYAKEAAHHLNIHPSILKLGMTHPLPPELIRSLAQRCDRLLVCEELEPIVEEGVRSLLGPQKVYGTLTGHIPREGELNPDVVIKALSTLEGIPLKPHSYPKVPARTPSLCAGCPHRPAYYAIKKALGGKGVVVGDRGCYNQGVYPPLSAIDVCVCMGSSIPIACGLYQSGIKPVVAVIGDSTFFHAGMPGLLNAAYNNVPITVVILDNSRTSMTGHQPNPGTGVTAMGHETVVAIPEDIVRSFWADYIRTVDPMDVGETTKTMREALEFPGLSVVICRHPCAIVEGRYRHRVGVPTAPFMVNSEKCTGCRSCVALGCPGIEFIDGTAKINGRCVGCSVCAQVCPAGAIERRGGS